MAYGAQASGIPPLIRTIYVWPTPALIAVSWNWPPAWHQAYAHLAGALGVAAMLSALEGKPIDELAIEMPDGVDSVTFKFAQTATSIHITVTSFTGPDAPGPNGGARQQPCTIDGLVLGLRGSGKYLHLVVFYGYMPPTPITNILVSGAKIDIRLDINGSEFFTQLNAIFTSMNYSRSIPRLRSEVGVYSSSHDGDGCVHAAEGHVGFRVPNPDRQDVDQGY